MPARSAVASDNPIPTPPFWGTRVVKGVAVGEYAGMVDERALFLGQWGLRGVRGGSGPSYEELVETEGRPRLRYWLERLSTEGVLAHAAVVYGYFPAVADGDELVVLEEPKPDALERYRLAFPRQRRDRHLCLADFWRPRELAVANGEVDVLPLHLVTMGQPIADYANELFAKDAYRDYLEVHGLSVQLTEALAEFWHKRMRAELLLPDGSSMADTDPSDLAGILANDYRGCRFAFGYPACPDLEDRAAKYLPQQNPLLINADFRVFTDMVDRWCKRYAHVPGARPVVEQVVRVWFEQQLVEAVMGALTPRGSNLWTMQDLEKVWTDDAYRGGAPAISH
jgi:5-methyltetrahydrofolate--homocysteine methyltransferase